MGLNLLDIAIWWLVLEFVGFLALPVSFYLCHNLKDHGYSASKPLGLLLITYFSWMISVFTGYSYFSVLFSFVLTGIISLLFFFIDMKKKHIPLDKKYIFKFEILFFIAFIVFAIIRAYSPDIYWTGGEKFMDMTFINSMLRTTEFPPLDPWMSGTVTYYYYFGYLIVANLINISGVFPSIAFNLATASFFALSFTTAFGIGFNLTEKIKYGIITAFFVTIAGNLVGFFQLLDILIKENYNSILSFSYWTSSRVIPDTINEFPFFSFLQGDVHAHMISITFQLLVIVLLLNIMRSTGLDFKSILIAGLAIGFLYPLNTWDYPVYLVLGIIVTITNLVLSSKPGRKKDFLNPIISIATMAAASYLLYLPYHLSYKIDKSILLVPSGRSSLIFYIAIFGFFLFMIYSFIYRNIRNDIGNNSQNNITNNNNTSKSCSKTSNITANIIANIPKVSSVFLLIAALITIFEIKVYIFDNVEKPKINEFELLLLLLPLIALMLLSILKEKDKNNVFVLILMIIGVFVSLFCEILYIQDALGSGSPDFIRLNTVFKFYLQNWILWGVCASYVLFLLREQINLKKAWGIIAVILILMVSIYPVFATLGKSGGFAGTPDLNGEAYVEKEHPQDYQAILWFRNITGKPVVLQAPGELYEWNCAITTFTGLPTVIGWAGHEINWRFPNRSEIDRRWSDVGRIYTSGDIRKVEELLKKYNVSYVYFGEAEAKRFRRQGLFEKYPERFRKVFEYRDVVVYDVHNEQ
jgi:YYY domain-containing protein